MRRGIVVVALLSAACGAFLGLDEEEPPPDNPPPVVDAAPPPDVTGSETSGCRTSDVDCSCAPDCGAVPACTTPPCAPQLVTQLAGTIYAIARNLDGLVVAHAAGGMGQIESFAFVADGGAGPRTNLDPTCDISTCPSARTSIVVHNSGIYWGTQNQLNVRRDGGNQVFGSATVVNGLALENNTLYWAQGLFGNSLIGFCDLPGCTNADQFGTINNAYDVRPAAGFIFYTIQTPTPQSNTINQHYKSNLVQSPTPFSRLAHFPNTVVYAHGSGLHLVDFDGNKKVFIEEDAGTPIASVATDGQYIYFMRQRRLERCVVTQAPCTPLLIAETPTSINIAASDAIMIDATHVYWGTNSGELFRTSKPP